MIIEDTTGLSVRNLQGLLRNVAYYVDDIPFVIPDGIYGTETTDAVKAFQLIYGLPVTGEMDADTWRRLRNVSNELREIYCTPETCIILPDRITYTFLDNAPELYVIQAMILALGSFYPEIPDIQVTGIHDESSVNAVKYLQNIAGLDETGDIDTKTFNSINRIYSTIVKNPTRN